MTKVEAAAFALETVAHLQGQEHELLPLAEHLRAIAEATRQRHIGESVGYPVTLLALLEQLK